MCLFFAHTAASDLSNSGFCQQVRNEALLDEVDGAIEAKD